MFSGIWGIPYAMPAPTPLNLVVGAPIMVPKMEGKGLSQVTVPVLSTILLLYVLCSPRHAYVLIHYHVC